MTTVKLNPRLERTFRAFDPATSPVYSLLLSAAAAASLYALVFTRRFWLADLYPGGFQNVSHLMGFDYTGMALWVGGVAGAFVLWLVVLRAATALQPGSRVLLLLLLAAAVQFIVLVPTYPATNADVFHYLGEARVLWVHDGNPLIDAPIEYGMRDIATNMAWDEQPSPYGPLWAVLGGIPIAVSGDDPLAAVLAFKVMSILFWLGTAVVAYVGVLARYPSKAPLAFAFIAMNPLAVMLIAIGGQNDTAMAFFVALGLLLIVLRMWRVAPLAFVAAALVKAPAALLLPLVLVYMVWRAPRSDTLVGWGAAAVAAVLLYAPFWEGRDTFDVINQQSKLWSSSLGLMVETGWDQPRASVERVVRPAAYAVFGATALGLTAVWAKTKRDFLELAGWVLFAYLTLAVLWFQPWYVLWLFPAAAVALSARLLLAVGVLSFTAMMAYVSLEFAQLWWADNEWADKSAIVAPAAVLLPPFIAVGAHLLAQRLQSRESSLPEVSPATSA